MLERQLPLMVPRYAHAKQQRKNIAIFFADTIFFRCFSIFIFFRHAIDIAIPIVHPRSRVRRSAQSCLMMKNARRAAPLFCQFFFHADRALSLTVTRPRHLFAASNHRYDVYVVADAFRSSRCLPALLAHAARYTMGSRQALFDRGSRLSMSKPRHAMAVSRAGAASTRHRR